MTRLLLAIALVASALEGAHPQYILDAAHLSFIRGKRAANTADWQALKAVCDGNLAKAVRYPNAVGDTSTVMVPGSGADNVNPLTPDYAGTFFLDNAFEFGACYQALALTDPTTAAAYAAKAHYLIRAMTTAPVWMAVSGGGTYAVVPSDGAKNWGTAGNLVRLWVTAATVPIGATVTVTGSLGCTSANGTWTVAAYTSGYVTLVGAPTYNANCTSYNFNILNDASFAYRHYPQALAALYDWVYDGLSSDDRAAAIATLNRWYDELVRANDYNNQPANNYFYGLFNGLVASYAASLDDNPSYSATMLAEINRRLTQLRNFRARWDVGGGSEQGWNAYGSNSARALAHASYAMLRIGADWRNAPTNFDPLDDFMHHYMQFVTPGRVEMDDYGYVSRGSGYTAPEFVYLGNAVAMRYFAARMSNPKAAQFANWYDAVYTAIETYTNIAGNRPRWNFSAYERAKPAESMTFLFYDAAQATADFTATTPLTGTAFSGNYLATRDTWAADSVYITYWGGPEIGFGGNGKNHYISGMPTMQRGNVRLLINGHAESARNYAISPAGCHDNIHNDAAAYKNHWSSQFYAGGNTLHGLGGTPISPAGSIPLVTSYPTQLDAWVDGGNYVYWRTEDLKAPYTPQAGLNPVTRWTRHAVYVRPKVLVVFDRTATRTAGQDRAMRWAFAKYPTPVAAPAGMGRYDVIDGATFKGAITTVLPAGHRTTVTDYYPVSGTACPNPLGLIYRVEVRPSASDHTDDVYLAVIDAADSSQAVAGVSRLTGTNIHAVQIGTGDVVGFVPGSAPVLPISYTFAGQPQHTIAGLGANASYHVTIGPGGTVTISAAAGSGDVASNEAGVLSFDSTGPVVIPPSVLTVALPSGTVGTAYAATLAAAGTPPFTWSIAGGALPSGTSLGAGSGVISGVPDVAGGIRFTVRASNGAGTSDKELDILIAGPPASAALGISAQGVVIR